MRYFLPLVALSLFLAACAGPALRGGWTMAPPASDSTATSTAGTVAQVFKSPTCSCCHEWEAYLRANGYTVTSVATDDITRIKNERGIPQAARSCHTALIGGYFVEGHVPIEAIEDLLEQRPPIDGIALPGMPAGSPGMPGEKEGPFEILAIVDGDSAAFGAY